MQAPQCKISIFELCFLFNHIKHHIPEVYYEVIHTSLYCDLTIGNVFAIIMWGNSAWQMGSPPRGSRENFPRGSEA